MSECLCELSSTESAFHIGVDLLGSSHEGLQEGRGRDPRDKVLCTKSVLQQDHNVCAVRVFLERSENVEVSGDFSVFDLSLFEWGCPECGVVEGLGRDEAADKESGESQGQGLHILIFLIISLSKLLLIAIDFLINYIQT